MELTLNILTLNVWGIPFISKDRDIRMLAISDELTSGKYDIVSLQEVWSEKDYQLIKSRTKSILPFAHYFYSGVVGSGLCILSKYPIVSTFFHQWSVNGYFHRIQHGDWFGGKGVGLCKILWNKNIIHVYTAHLHAEYDRKCDDYMSHRVIQAFDTAQFIENTQGDSILQILAGDLNTEPGDLAYRVLLSTSKLTDSFTSKNKLITDKHLPDIIGTNECKANSYKTIDGIEKRIDYILYKFNKNYLKNKINYKINYNLPLSQTIPGYNCSYSDHEAVLGQFLITITADNSDYCLNKNINFYNNDDIIEDINNDDIENNNIIKKSLMESIDICNESINLLSNKKFYYFLQAFIILFILIFIIDLIPPYGFYIIYFFIKFLFIFLILYFLFMATIWNVQEYHGIMSGKLSMEIYLNNYKKFD